MDVCEGEFSPNATAKDAKPNVVKCTTLFKTGRYKASIPSATSPARQANITQAQYNITALVDHELSVGPLNLNLADLGFTKDLQHEFSKISTLFRALAIVYILAVFFTGLSLLASIAAFFRPGQAAAMANLAVAVLAALLLQVGGVATTVGVWPAARMIQELGGDIGLQASAGRRFLIMAWVAFALMAVATACWGWEVGQNIRCNRMGKRMRVRHGHQQHTDAFW